MGGNVVGINSEVWQHVTFELKETCDIPQSPRIVVTNEDLFTADNTALVDVSRTILWLRNDDFKSIQFDKKIRIDSNPYFLSNF